MPELNVELFDETLQHVIDHPEQHDQTSWRSECGTTCCFAGRAVALAGARWVREEYTAQQLGTSDQRRAYLFAEEDDPHSHRQHWRVYDEDGTERTVPVVFVRRRAERLLGLTENQASMLFLVAQTRDDALRVAKEIRDGVDYRRDDDGDLVPVYPEPPTR